ncbi:hypothetical protein AVEN_201938-1 [Araneus ventricosus]|uniref:Uncharacterized protein n=1 Tax=Araneus ventricosus TaxID=182803 RepID=A0A4Y2QAR2_ARAVE|nr:hypothetical protein AVEN_201938-1 [Araneus ventricosus]
METYAAEKVHKKRARIQSRGQKNAGRVKKVHKESAVEDERAVSAQNRIRDYHLFPYPVGPRKSNEEKDT